MAIVTILEEATLERSIKLLDLVVQARHNLAIKTMLDKLNCSIRL